MSRKIILSKAQLFVKRLFDIVASFLMLMVLLPVLIIVALFVKCEDGGSVFYGQKRVGKGGKIFVIYKFRSMVMGAEPDDAPQLCQEGDKRVTKVGKYIRQYHLDELPQLWNVLIGDMSLVGYRPERPYFVSQIIQRNADYELLYAMRPGIFSYAAIYNGYTDTMEKMLERLRMDLDYMQNGTLFTDIKIIVLTAVDILSGKKI